MRWITIALALVLWPGALPAQDEAALRLEVRKLVQELDADTRTTRLAAERTLLEMGPKILPFLPSAELVGPGARESLAKLRFELERRLARESLLPSRVNLGGERTVAAWVEHFETTGNALDVSRLSPEILARKVTLPPQDGATFWKALEALKSAAQVRPDERTVRGELTLIPAAGDAPLAEDLRGAFRTRLTQAVFREGLVADEDLLRLTLELEAEPRLRPLFLKYAGRDVTAGSLPPLSPEGKYELLLADGLRPARIQCDFRRPKSDAARTLDIAGRFHVTVAAGSEAIRFTDLEPLTRKRAIPVSRRRGGVTVAVQKVLVNEAEQELRLEVRVSYDSGGPAFESHRAWLLHNRAYLELPGGKTLELNAGLDPLDQSDGAQTAAYAFRDVPAPLGEIAFVYVAPTLIIETPVEMKFTGVPLP